MLDVENYRMASSDGYKHAMAMYEQLYKMTKKKLVSQDSLSSVAFIESCL